MSDALRSALRTHRGLLGELASAAAEPNGGPGPAQLAASGPRTATSGAEYELLVEMILEGSRLHYGSPSVIRPEDPDVALLLGDQLYALGLSRLAMLGDLEATCELADVISLIAQAYAASDEQLADAVWEAGAVAIGWGASDAHDAAKERARVLDRGAAQALLEAARERATSDAA